jgi:hypothetical protein
MEISPVPGIRDVPAVQSKAVAFGLPAVLETQSLVGIGDETYSPANGESAGGDEEAFDEPLEEDEEDPTLDTKIGAIEDGRRIRLIA